MTAFGDDCLCRRRRPLKVRRWRRGWPAHPEARGRAGKGWALVQELDLGEVTGVICDLCEKKGIPCQWSKVSILGFFSLFFFTDFGNNRRLPVFGLVWATNRPGLNVKSVAQGRPIRSKQGRWRVWRWAPPSGYEGIRCGNHGMGRAREEQSLLHS